MKLTQPSAKDTQAFDALNAAFMAQNHSLVLALAPGFLKKHPNHAPVLNMLAVALAQTGRSKEALPYMKRVVALVPNELTAHLNLSRAYMALGDNFSAEEVFLTILERWPNAADAYANYGTLLQSVGKKAEAEAMFRQGLAQDSMSFINQRNWAALLHSQNRLDEAEEQYRAILAQSANLIAEFELGNVLKDLHRLDDASTQYRAVLVKNPGNLLCLLLLADALNGLKQFDEAELSYRKALTAAPQHEVALMKFGNFLRDQKRGQEAETYYRQGQAMAPKNPLFSLNLGELLRDQGRLDEAQACFEKALETHPSDAQLHGNLANLFVEQRAFAQAQAAYYSLIQRDLSNLVARSNLFYLLDVNSDPEPPRLRADKIAFGLEMQRRATGLAFTEWRCNNGQQGLRVGLVSGDLRDHPVGHFLEGMLAQMNTQAKGQIEFIAYANTPTRDALTERIAPFFTAWRTIKALDDFAAAELIYQDSIHVLIDLTGHTAGNRLGVFTYRPAPVQVSWLGYFASTGLHEMDYLLTDPWAIAPESTQYFSETLWPLPRTRLCFTPPRVSMDVQPLPAQKNGFVTFGCFNQAVKLNEYVLATWAEILHAVPQSQLFLKTKAFGGAAEQKKIRQQFAILGVAPERILLEGAGTREEYLACFNRVDISLDPFPYTGGTTTVESLWMGVPVLSLAGQTMVARQGLGLLMNAGLADWVAPTRAIYIAKAAELSANLPALAALRERLRAQVLASPIFDGQGFAQDFAKTIHALWHHHSTAPRKQPMLPPYRIDASGGATVYLVSATQLSEADFWAKSALGQSLPYHLAQDARIKPRIAFNNTRGLPEIFNEAIEQADDDDMLVFMHDDVWIDEIDTFTEQLRDGLRQFDVIGVAGNRRRVPNQPSWKFVDTNFTSDAAEFLSGQIAHGTQPYGATGYFGEVPATCELLDGVFLATLKNRLHKKKVRFDPKFDFHLYDLDFCRTARKAKLSLGTWPVRLTHQSAGNYFSRHWLGKAKLYLKKWGS